MPMPRQARLDGPSLLHQLTGRAIERGPLFTEPDDYGNILDHISEIGQRVAAGEGVAGESHFQKGRAEGVSCAKSKVIYMGVKYLGRTNHEIALMARMSNPSPSNERK